MKYRINKTVKITSSSEVSSKYNTWCPPTLKALSIKYKIPNVSLSHRMPKLSWLYLFNILVNLWELEILP